MSTAVTLVDTRLRCVVTFGSGRTVFLLLSSLLIFSAAAADDDDDDAAAAAAALLLLLLLLLLMLLLLLHPLLLRLLLLPLPLLPLVVLYTVTDVLPTLVYQKAPLTPVLQFKPNNPKSNHLPIFYVCRLLQYDFSRLLAEVCSHRHCIAPIVHPCALTINVQVLWTRHSLCRRHRIR
jgi:hypothetical protein